MQDFILEALEGFSKDQRPFCEARRAENGNEVIGDGEQGPSPPARGLVRSPNGSSYILSALEGISCCIPEAFCTRKLYVVEKALSGFRKPCGIAIVIACSHRRHGHTDKTKLSCLVLSASAV